MPKIIYALRHAKAAPGTAAMADEDRPLNERGTKDALALGKYMKKEWLRPDLALCSPAIRTRQTLQYAQEGYGDSWTAEYAQKLYLPDPSHIFTMLSVLPDDIGSAMVISHNPGIHAFCLSLAGSGDRDAREMMIISFPTAAMAIIELDTQHWKNIRPGSGHLTKFILPENL